MNHLSDVIVEMQRKIDELRAELAALKAQEPVAIHQGYNRHPGNPLYAAPVPAVTLTNEQIDAAVMFSFGYINNRYRKGMRKAIETALKGETK